jgi:four helix bundle protein
MNNEQGLMNNEQEIIEGESRTRARIFDLERRLINFAVLIIGIVETMRNSKSGKYLAGQLTRCGTSPALNYGEAQSSESQKDFIHKIKIVLKELRETHICLKIIYQSNLFKDENRIKKALKENNELISIFVKSAQTAQKKLRK